jgi:hypothetical protein
MQVGDISVFIGSDGSKQASVVMAVNPDATVDIHIFKVSQRGVKLSSGSEPGTFFDPTMPLEVVAQDSTLHPPELPMREPAADDIAATIPVSEMSAADNESADAEEPAKRSHHKKVEAE